MVDARTEQVDPMRLGSRIAGRHRGFTLIEVLIAAVLLVVGLVGSIALILGLIDSGA